MANSFLNKIITREKKEEAISSQKAKPTSYNGQDYPMSSYLNMKELESFRSYLWSCLQSIYSLQHREKQGMSLLQKHRGASADILGYGIGIANIAKQERNRAAKLFDALMKFYTSVLELAVPLREYKQNFPQKRYLHPYEWSLVELTFGEGKYEEVLGRVDTLRKKLLSVGEQHVSLCAQVTDTPGLLTRHDDDRNDLERLTLAVLTHLPTAILYVHDLTGERGTSPDDKFITYNEIKERFSGHLWIDVVSKRDLLQDPPSNFVADDDVGRYKKFGPDGAIRVSVKSEVGITELKGMVHDLLQPQMAKIREEDNKQAG